MAVTGVHHDRCKTSETRRGRRPRAWTHRTQAQIQGSPQHKGSAQADPKQPRTRRQQFTSRPLAEPGASSPLPRRLLPAKRSPAGSRAPPGRAGHGTGAGQGDGGPGQPPGHRRGPGQSPAGAPAGRAGPGEARRGPGGAPGCRGAGCRRRAILTRGRW